MIAVRLDDPDLRVAAALLLGCAAAKAAVPGTPGVPCGLRELTGIPCPLCGLTTSVTEVARLHVGSAFAANPAGPLLVLVAAAVLAGVSRRFVVRPAVVYLALSAMWVWELHRFGAI